MIYQIKSRSMSFV